MLPNTSGRQQAKGHGRGLGQGPSTGKEPQCLREGRCREAGVVQSMGSVGDAYDNAMCESFFATLECELLDRSRFPTPADARREFLKRIGRHRPPGAVKFMWGKNLTATTPEDRCRHSVNRFPSHFKGAGAAG